MMWIVHMLIWFTVGFFICWYHFSTDKNSNSKILIRDFQDISFIEFFGPLQFYLGIFVFVAMRVLITTKVVRPNYSDLRDSSFYFKSFNLSKARQDENEIIYEISLLDYARYYEDLLDSAQPQWNSCHCGRCSFQIGNKMQICIGNNHEAVIFLFLYYIMF